MHQAHKKIYMKRSIKIFIVLFVVLFVVVGAIIGIGGINKKSEEVLIVATNFPAYDFARAVAGDKADIKMLIKPGVELHDFEPTPSDIIDIKNSELFIYTGGESDGWIENILGDIDTDKTKIFKMMDVVNVVEEEIVDGMEEEYRYEYGYDNGGDKYQHYHDEEEIEYDEHVWTSVKNAVKIINSIRDELTEISPENKQVFEENAKKYTNQLADLDLEFQNIVSNGNRKTIIFGDRFPLRYFVDDYGLNYYAAFPGCSEQTEANSRTIAFLVEKIKSENIPVVLKIEMSSGNIAKTIADETGAKVLTFNAAHNISADDFKSGRTYAEIMKENLTVLEEALK